MNIGERIKTARGSLSQGEFAEAIGVSKAAIGGYERGQQTPGATVIASICERFDVEPRWLLLGQGPMRREEQEIDRTNGSPSNTGELHGCDLDLIEAAISAVEEVLEATERSMPVPKKAQLITAIYDLYSDTERPVDKDRVLRLVKSAV